MRASFFEDAAGPLHALWHHGQLHIFGENGSQTGAALRSTAGSLFADALVTSAAADSQIELWLPAADDTPFDSSTAPEIASPAALKRFRLPSLAFDAADAVDLLMSTRPEALERSASLRFWSGIARYLTGLLARKQFVPDYVESRDHSFIATWRIFLLDPRELHWLEAYASRMPPVCRARAATNGGESDPAGMVDRFMSEASDAIIRRSLRRDPFFEDIPQRAVEEGGWELSWLAGLISESPDIRAPREECAPVAADVSAWLSQLVEESSESPPRLGFRLIEPIDAEATDPQWRLQFELRSAEDERLLDIRAIWGERGAATVLGARMHGRRAHLLAELTRAAQSASLIGRALAAGDPTGLDLTTAEAFSFLRDIAPVLANNGFDVELPAWAENKQQRFGLHLNLRPMSPTGGLGVGGMGLGTLLEFDWRIAVGEKDLSIEEFESLVRQKTPLVRLRETWISMDQEAARRALEFLKRESRGQMTLLGALRLAGGGEEGDSGIPVIGLSGADWLNGLLRNTPDVEVEMLQQPDGFLGTLRPYQLRGLSWLSFLDRIGLGSCLADDMGLGKTIQLIALMLHERLEGKKAGPTLLFAPMSVVGNWQREISRFAPNLRVLVFHGPLRLGGDAFAKAAVEHDVVITTYGLAGRELATFQRVSWHRIAMDEAQKIKNPTAHQSVALRTLAAPHKVALTGTPIENHLAELWSIMDVLNPGLLGSASSFRARYAVPIEKSGNEERADQLRRIIRPFMLRRLKSDPAVACDLPEKMEMRVFCNLTREQAALYEKTVSRMLEEVDEATGIRRRGLILAGLTKLKQICNHPEHFLGGETDLDGRSGKCERIVEMLEEVMEEGDAALVFTQYREMGELLYKMLKNRLRIELPFLHGGTPMKKRNELIARFQESGTEVPVFLLSLKAGGFGLNLTKANHVFHFDRWWNPAVEAQATDRAHRIGQTRRVQVHKFVCIGTVEERIDKLLSEKMALADRIVGSGDEWLTGLSTVELKDYLSLTSDAVAED